MDLETKKEVLRHRLKGLNFSEISRKLNISRSAAHAVTETFMFEWEMLFEVFQRIEDLEANRALTIFLIKDWLLSFIVRHEKAKAYEHEHYLSELQTLVELQKITRGSKALNELFETSVLCLIDAVKHDAARAEYNTFKKATPTNISKVSLAFDKEVL